LIAGFRHAITPFSLFLAMLMLDLLRAMIAATHNDVDYALLMPCSLLRCCFRLFRYLPPCRCCRQRYAYFRVIHAIADMPLIFR